MASLGQQRQRSIPEADIELRIGDAEKPRRQPCPEFSRIASCPPSDVYKLPTKVGQPCLKRYYDLAVPFIFGLPALLNLRFAASIFARAMAGAS